MTTHLPQSDIEERLRKHIAQQMAILEARAFGPPPIPSTLTFDWVCDQMHIACYGYPPRKWMNIFDVTPS